MHDSFLFNLSPGDVHVWHFTLDVPDALSARYEATLAPDELKRADRFRRDVLRSRFVAGRGALRAILGSYLGIEPVEVVFAYGNRGKPALSGLTRGALSLEFNLAHTDSLALCALSLGRPVGVDVERLRPMNEAERIIGRYFTPREQAEFLGYAEPERVGAFFRGWARKEAYLKATGDGLAASLDSFEVSLTAGAAALLRVGDDPAAAGRWTLRELDAPSGFVAALAVEGPLGTVTIREWLGAA